MVKRYDLVEGQRVRVMPAGSFVEHADYGNLLALAKELAHLVEYDLGDQVEDAARVSSRGAAP